MLVCINIGEVKSAPNKRGKGISLNVEKRVASRIRGEERRSQIVATVVRLVGQYGLDGTTLSRVASEVGVSEMALYRYFESKNDMLAAALAHLVERAAEWMVSSSHPWVPTRLREIGRAHFDMLTSDIDMWTAPMMQFVISRSARSPQLRVAAQYLDGRLYDGSPTYVGRAGTRDTLARHLNEGKAQGSVRSDVDALAFSFQWMSWAQGENLHFLVAEGADFDREPHLRLLDLIVASVESPRG